MSNADEPEILNVRPRASTSVTLDIPADSYETLSRVAENRDMSPDALLKFYIGQGLRQDVARLFSERVMRTTAQVLAKHIASERNAPQFYARYSRPPGRKK